VTPPDAQPALTAVAPAEVPPAEVPPDDELAERRRAGPLRPILLILVAVGGLLLFYLSPLHAMFVPSGIELLRDRLAEFGAWSPAAFVVLAALCVGFGAPRLAFAAAGGLLFGWWLGSLLAQAGTIVGCAITFAWSRRLGRDFARRVTGPRLARLIGRVERHPVATNVMLRICPIGNSLALNLLFGLSPIGARDFLVGTFLGTLPETVIYALFGSSAHTASAKMVLTAGFLLLVLAVLSTWLLRRSTDPDD
jgi:uncharacterized membrane protein YdjX (TVP38/TMEM64 family)